MLTCKIAKFWSMAWSYPGAHNCPKMWITNKKNQRNNVWNLQFCVNIKISSTTYDSKNNDHDSWRKCIRISRTYHTSSALSKSHELGDFLLQDLSFILFLQIEISPLSYLFSQQRLLGNSSSFFYSAFRSSLDFFHVW